MKSSDVDDEGSIVGEFKVNIEHPLPYCVLFLSKNLELRFSKPLLVTSKNI